MLIILFTKAALLLGVWVCFKYGTFSELHYRNNFTYPPGAPITLASAYQTWDAHHYLYLADEGYKKTTPEEKVWSHVMLPLFPFTVTLFKPIFGGRTLLSGLVLSNVFSFAAFLVFFKWASRVFSPETACRSVMYAIAFPTAFFFTRVYGESLFLLLSALFLYYLYRDDYKRAALFSFVMPFTRLVGLLAVVPFGVYVITKARQSDTPAAYLKKNSVWVCAPVVGMLTEMVLMYFLTGNARESFSSQETRFSILGMLNIPRWFYENFMQVPWAWHGFANSFWERVAFLGYLFFLWRIWRGQDKTLFAYALVMGMVPALSDHFISYSRFLIIIFPIFIAMAKMRLRHRLIWALMFACQFVLSTMHALNYWVA